MDINPVEFVTLDSGDNNSRYVQETYGYLNLQLANLMTKKLNEIILSISKENPESKHPLAAYKISAKTVELIFANNDAREKAVSEGLLILSKTTTIERPKPLKLSKVIYIYGMPITEKDDAIKQFFLENFKLEVTSQLRWLTFPQTQIRNGGRSAVVSFENGTEIPGFTWYKSAGMRIPKKLAIWYPDMPNHCRKCFQSGHLAHECEIPVENPNENRRSYAGVISRRKPENQQQQNDVIDEIPMENLATNATKLRQQVTSSSQLNLSSASVTNGENQYQPFYNRSDIFSNFYETQFVLDGETYDSTEQYLFSEKALFLGDKESAEKIMNCKQAKYCKEIGKSVQWKGDVESWREFAKEKLRKANIEKYAQNERLRKVLFESYPKILVEANPYDTYWGVGLKRNDKSIQNPSAWEGKNTMGYLLTDIRNVMLKNPQYALTTEPRNKRALISPDRLTSKRVSTSSV